MLNKKLLFLYLVVSSILSGCFSFFDDSSKIVKTQIKDQTVFLPNKSFETNNYLIKDLLSSWVSSKEEERSISKIYRPANYKIFPPKRFRGRIIFYDKGRCEYLVMASNDQHYFTKCRWRLLKENPNIIYLFNDKAQLIRRLQINKLEENLFKFTILH